MPELMHSVATLPRGSTLSVHGLALAAIALVSMSSSSLTAETSLSRRIDSAIESPLKVAPAQECNEAEFVRRIYLDLTGVIPSPQETRRFLDDAPTTEKRTALIDQLLASPAYARRMQIWFDVMLMERRPDVSIPSSRWRAYLRRAFLENRPYNELVREILSSDGADPLTRPAAKFYLDRKGDVNLLTRDIARLFLGRDLQCCQCHDHPLIDDYHQVHYYGLVAFLNRSFVFTDKNKKVFVGEKGVSDLQTFKSVFFPDENHETLPRVLDRQPINEPRFPKDQEYLVAPADGVRPVPKFSRREQLALAITAADNRDFAKNTVNRLWAMMMGRGLVEPLDLHHSENPPSHPELLDALADALVESGFNVKTILREIARSQTYQRSSVLPEGVEEELVPPESYAVAALRPLSPEQLCFSLLQALGLSDVQRAAVDNQLRTADPRLNELLSVDPAREALREQLAEQAVFDRLKGNLGAFVGLFGGPAGSPQDRTETTVHQALFLTNSAMANSWLGTGVAGLVHRLTRITNSSAVADELYLSVLSRRPSDVERGEVSGYLAARGDPRVAALQELAWALCMSPEFRFNH